MDRSRRTRRDGPVGGDGTVTFRVAGRAGTLAAALVALGTAFLPFGEAQGQCIHDCGDFGDDQNPTVALKPSTTTFNATPASATVCWDDNMALDGSTREIELNGSDVTGDFTWETAGSTCDGYTYQSDGQVDLNLGDNSFSGRICDDSGNCTTETATYTLDDTSSPGVSISPSGGGTYTSSDLSVTVDWCDDIGLDGSSRKLTLNGSDVTGSFDYTSGSGGCTDSKQSDGTVTLTGGDNTFEARICDDDGNCTTSSATYTYDEPDTSPPTISIDPGDTTFGSPDQSVTVEWCDTESLDKASRSITLDGSDVTGQFTWENGSQNCAVAKVSEGTISMDPGSHTLEASICDDAGNCGSSSASYTYDDPPQVDLTPHNGEYRDVAKCAVDCFDASVSWSTPAYFSRDRARSLAFLYRSSQADPRGLVEADVEIPSDAPTPDRFSLRLKRPDGTWVDFAGSLGKEVFWDGTADTRRLAAQFDASGAGTGAHDYTLVVRTWYDSDFQETTKPVTVLVVDREASPYGAGWSVAGLQRLHFLSDGDIAVEEGDGSLALFTQTSSTTWAAPRGDWTELVERSDGNYERRYPGGRVLVYNSAGRLVTSSDRFGNATTFTYSSGKLTSVTDPAGEQITLAYGSDGKLAWVEGAGGRRTTVTIDAHGDLTSVEDPAGGFPLSATYDADHRMRVRTDRGGGSWGFAYDFAGKIAADTMPEVEVEGTLTRPVAGFTSLASQVLVDPGSGTGTSSSPATAPSPGSLQAATTDTRGNTTTYEVDRWGAATRVVTPLNGSVDVTTEITRDDSARVVETLSSSGRHMAFSWEGPDRVEVANRTGSTVRRTNVEYESTWHQPVRVYGDDVAERKMWYGADGALDSVRRVSSDTLTDGPTTRFEHDDAGRVIERTDPEGHVTTVAYQSGGFENRKRVVGAVGDTAAADTTRFFYDGFGRRVETELPTGDVTRVGFDVLNRRTLAVNAHGDTTRLEYGDLYLTQVTDAVGQTYKLTKNALGWTTERTDPRGNAATFVHDAAGNVVKRTGRAGRVVTFDHNAAGQVVSRTADGETTTFSRNPNVTPSWVAASNPASTDTIWTDELGRRVKETTIRDGTGFTVRYSYDGAGRQTKVEVTSGGSTPYTAEMMHSGYSIFKQLVDVRGDTTDIILDADGRPTKIRYPNGDSVLVSGTSTHRMSRLEWGSAALEDAFGLSFAVDSLGRLEERIFAGSDTTRRFAYDERGWLTAHTDQTYDTDVSCTTSDGTVTGTTCTSSGGTQVDSVDYTYDAVGNRTDSGASIATGNRLTSFDGYTLSWDAAGHLTDKSGNGLDQSFFWDADGALDSVTTDGHTTRYRYDGFGRRISKSGPGGTVQYVYSRRHVLLELDGAESVTAKYTYFPGIDRPHSVVRGGAKYYYAHGMTNSVLGLFDASGSPVNRYRYSPWGQTASASESVQNPYRYTGRRYDEGPGLYHNRARYYDPDLGRFISQDPLGLAAGINPYVYAGNDPVNALDPSGLAPLARPPCPETGMAPPSGSRPAHECPPLTVNAGGGGSWGLGATMMFGPKPQAKKASFDVPNDLSAGGPSRPDVGRPGVSLPQGDTLETEETDQMDFPGCTEAKVLTTATMAFDALSGLSGSRVVISVARGVAPRIIRKLSRDFLVSRAASLVLLNEVKTYADFTLGAEWIDVFPGVPTAKALGLTDAICSGHL